MSLVAEVTKWVIKDCNGRIIIRPLVFLNLSKNKIYLKYFKITFQIQLNKVLTLKQIGLTMGENVHLLLHIPTW